MARRSPRTSRCRRTARRRRWRTASPSPTCRPVIGSNVYDYSGYPDCRPEFIEAFERLATLATRAGVEGRQRVRVRTPLIRLTKAEIIRAGTAAGVDYALTLSCYEPASDGAACGRCDACALRRKGFAEAGVPDPTLYQE